MSTWIAAYFGSVVTFQDSLKEEHTRTDVRRETSKKKEKKIFFQTLSTSGQRMQ